jgi:hypothetical protein
MPAIDMTGRRFGYLTVIESAGSDHKGYALWRCRCDCGNETTVLGIHLRNSNTHSCGCLQREYALSGLARVKHEASVKGAWWPEYRAWVNALHRCISPRTHAYATHGGRGIKFCDRWRFGENGDDGFECFIADMGRKPAPHFRLRRLDTDADFSPDNCVWAPQGKLIKPAARAANMEISK